jgi:hypothetical protein
MFSMDGALMGVGYFKSSLDFREVLFSSWFNLKTYFDGCWVWNAEMDIFYHFGLGLELF